MVCWRTPASVFHQNKRLCRFLHLTALAAPLLQAHHAVSQSVIKNHILALAAKAANFEHPNLLLVSIRYKQAICIILHSLLSCFHQSLSQGDINLWPSTISQSLLIFLSVFGKKVGKKAPPFCHLRPVANGMTLRPMKWSKLSRNQGHFDGSYFLLLATKMGKHLPQRPFQVSITSSVSTQHPSSDLFFCSCFWAHFHAFVFVWIHLGV